MVVTDLVLVGKTVTGAVFKGLDEAPDVDVIVVDVVAMLTGGGLVFNVGLARVVWISALRANAVLSFFCICSICSCRSCNSPS